MCNSHYENMRIRGNPIPKKDQSLSSLLAFTGWKVTDTGCWEWKGHRNAAGYGIISAKHLGIRGKRVHRLMYSLVYGGISSDLLVRHTCDNPPCINPNHLLSGTDQSNARDMQVRGRRLEWEKRDMRCRNGHDVSNKDAVQIIIKDGTQIRTCRICDRIRKRRWKQRNT